MTEKYQLEWRVKSAQPINGRRLRGAWLTARVLLLLAVAITTPARADAESRLPDDAPEASGQKTSKPFKLSLGHYRYDAAAAGTDLNLRYRTELATGWVGVYRDADFGQQWRVGLEQSYAPMAGVPLSLQWSAQIASRGFAGASITVEYGAPWFALVGLGRTNTKPYFNLNFDPNDAVSLGLGWRGPSGLTAYLLAVRDNRISPGQQNLHAVLRLPIGDQQRLSFDLQRKSGLGEDRQGTDWALTLTWDWRDWSIRLADDRKQNFSDVNALRLSVAYRF